MLHDFIPETIQTPLDEIKTLFKESLSSDIPQLSELMGHIPARNGKMLRPILLLLSGKLCGEITDVHKQAAVIVELIHVATLLHDDVLDEAKIRRNKETINNLHGNEIAILLGDILLSTTFIHCSKLENKYIENMIASTTRTVCQGEIIQLYNRGRYDLDENNYIDIITRKTASLMGLCCEIGSHISGASMQQCEKLKDYGISIGIAFQIADDITDIISNESISGKTLGTDLIKERLTLPIIHYLDRGTESYCNSIKNQTIDQTILTQILTESGSIVYARKVAQDYIDRAKDCIKIFDNEHIKDSLCNLANGIIDP